MAFGSGVLIATLTFSILVEAFSVTHTLPATVTGFILGGISFSLADYILKRKSVSKSPVVKQGNASDRKEKAVENRFRSIIIHWGPDGQNTRKCSPWDHPCNGRRFKYRLSSCYFISNLPEGLASTHGLKSNGQSTKRIYGLWLIALVIGTVSTVIGYTVLSYASPPVISISIAFAAGAILVMLADSMIPEAFKEGGILKGIALLAGFQIAAVLTRCKADETDEK
jgi:zinc transporter, ZIP family